MQLIEPIIVANIKSDLIRKLKPSRVVKLASLNRHLKFTEKDFEKRIINQVKYN